jgi:hypothetical protein
MSVGSTHPGGFRLWRIADPLFRFAGKRVKHLACNSATQTNLNAISREGHQGKNQRRGTKFFFAHFVKIFESLVVKTPAITAFETITRIVCCMMSSIQLKTQDKPVCN